jgi:PII-like signaling protein
MNSRSVLVVRIYLREGEHVLEKLVRALRDELQISGLTVLRGVLGFSENGELHPSSLLDLSLDLPLVVEFFEEPEKAERTVEKLLHRFDLDHVVCFPATACGGARQAL